jgi:4-hydroxymandelate oxidase
MIGMEELRTRAAEVLDPAVLDYYDGFAGTAQSAGEATAAWRAHRLRPRVLVDVAQVDTSVVVGGVRLDLPVLVAPAALHGLAHPEAERAVVAACVAAGSLPVISARASLPLEEMELPAGRWWQQLYVLRDRGITRELAARSRDLGAAALVVTGDAPVLARRRVGRGSLPQDALRVSPGVRALQRGDDLGAGEQAPDATLQDAVDLAAATGLPFWVKGVLRADDARRAVEAGAAGVIVSNHGGRQLDGAVATAVALPEVADAVGGRAEVLVDGGIRSGRDVFTALALGATAVCVARPALWALATGGRDGVHDLLAGLQEDLVEQLRLCGVPSAGAVSRDVLHPTGRT